jgi:hypothetical protein
MRYSFFHLTCPALVDITQHQADFGRVLLGLFYTVLDLWVSVILLAYAHYQAGRLGCSGPNGPGLS